MLAIAPLIVSAIGGALIRIAGFIVARVLVSLGMGYVMYTGITASLDWLRAQIVAELAVLGAQPLAVLSALRVGEALAIIFSALAIRWTFDGLNPLGAIKKLVMT